MPTRISQKDRMYAALRALRASTTREFALHQLNAAERAKMTKRLLDEMWTVKNFSRTRYTIAPRWRGDELTLLLEISHYLLPRELWARRRESGETYYRRELMYTLLALVQHKLGREAGKMLREEFVKNGVKYRPRRRVTPAQRAELARRSKFKNTKVVLDRALTKVSTAMLAAAEAKKAVTAARAQVATVTGRRRITLDDD